MAVVDEADVAARQLADGPYVLEPPVVDDRPSVATHWSTWLAEHARNAADGMRCVTPHRGDAREAEAVRHVSMLEDERHDVWSSGYFSDRRHGVAREHDSARSLKKEEV